MPKIVLKPNSPEYAEQPQQNGRPRFRMCEMPGCHAHGEYRAPKDRSLSEYYWFCHSHVQEYNTAWNFFSGMSDSDVEAHIIDSLYGDSPTWRSDSYRGFETELKRKIHEMWHFEEAPPEPDANPYARTTGNPELDALNIMGLSAPITFAEIKARYRILAKKYHPDSGQKSGRESEDLIKRINMAYTILKMAYQSEANTTPD